MKRKIVLATIAICLVAIVACGSLAYFSGTKTITNKFKVTAEGESEPEDGDDIFSVEVTEKDPLGNPTTSGVTYYEVIPGKVIAKEPVVKNTGKFDQWVRLTVTFTLANEWDNADTQLTKDNLFDKIILADANCGYDATKWDRGTTKKDSAANTVSYIFYYKNKLAPDETVALFKELTIPTYLDNDDMAELAEFDIKVTADAIQADNTGTTAKGTFESTNPVYWTEK